MRPTIALLLMIGLLLGPAYYSYCLFLSGRTLETFTMTERASRWVTTDGTIFRFPNGLAYKPVALELTPENNRVTLRLRYAFDESQDAHAKTDLRYQASLVQLDHTILERPITVRPKDSGSRTVDIGPMEIPYPAEYLFVLEQIGDAPVPPQLSLEVVEGVETPVRTVIWTGMVLLLTAAVIAVRDVVVATRTSRLR
jgi:hypothetical protein